MAEAYRRCQARQGRSSGALPGTAGYASQRRRSRAVLYHLSGQFEKHNRANRAKSKLQQLNKVLGSMRYCSYTLFFVECPSISTKDIYRICHELTAEITFYHTSL